MPVRSDSVQQRVLRKSPELLKAQEGEHSSIQANSVICRDSGVASGLLPLLLRLRTEG
jgi:hypothetical protein